MHDENFLKWYDRVGVERPSHESHTVVDTPENPLSEQLIQFKPTSWHLKGNVLYAETDHGPVVQTIPTDYICKGMDERGLPILVKLGE